MHLMQLQERAMEYHVVELHHGIEVDVVTDTGSWSFRIVELPAGGISVVVVDHLLGRPVIAQLLDSDR